tara:strand:- start:291 stop:803 length:513 start_codon:yes stop_codon:yes gene_type:complete
MRVSIVATALDGQQPEPKSVINMVHRIQNRNPGYSDFNNNGSTQSFSFSNPNNSIITNGANALKLDEEVNTENFESTKENETPNFSSPLTEHSEQPLENVENETNSPNEKQENEMNNLTSNGLENFQIDEEETPDLFNSDSPEQTFSSDETQDKDEDDLEIPAFLRRQQN